MTHISALSGPPAGRFTDSHAPTSDRPDSVNAALTPPETPADTGETAPGSTLRVAGLTPDESTALLARMPLQDAVKAALTLARERSHAAAERTERRDRRRKRRTRAPIEATDYAQMMKRMLRAHGRRVADADVEDLADLIALQVDLDEAIAYAVTESRTRHARSWADVARAAGSTKQAAQQRWGQR